MRSGPQFALAHQLDLRLHTVDEPLGQRVDRAARELNAAGVAPVPADRDQVQVALGVNRARGPRGRTGSRPG